ncbi:M48 family metallopeptidase [Acidovorax lacteus]|uniref:M48 family metallopeptidase n=1 Tax=Acidovorax lacteus TaxID=1924988 RepID=A0ABP8LEJ1_9BURK
MNRRDLMTLATLASGISAVSPVWAQFNFGKALEAGQDLVKAESITDEELKKYFDQVAEQMDSQSTVAPASNAYAKRLSKMVAGLQTHDGLRLNFKVYVTPQINAFAMANGTIRVYSGLMDQFSDDEVRYVIGHEIGHVKAGHSKSRMQAALRTSALRKGVQSSNTRAGALASTELGDLFEKVINAQHSQSNEREADDYALKFMKAKKYNAQACVTALEKLAALSGDASSSFLSTHPAPKDRAARMRQQLA